MTIKLVCDRCGDEQRTFLPDYFVGAECSVKGCHGTYQKKEEDHGRQAVDRVSRRR